MFVVDFFSSVLLFFIFPSKFLLLACRAFLLSSMFCLQWECLLACFSHRNVFDKVNAKAEVSLYQTNHDIDLLHLVNLGLDHLRQYVNVHSC